MEKNSQIWIWIIVILIIAAGIFFFFGNKQEANPITPITQETTEPESVQDVNNQDTIAKVVSLSYADALVQYADRRIQLDKTCQAHPNNVTYKDNTGIMIDNRSPETRTVKVGTTFTIKPYGFKIIVLPDIYLKSKTILVDCDGSQNVATILIQE
ncbi:MAG: hypothetical protein WC998_00895 [Candidatus Paceibacterota bacterium]|jgi:hypothetical protein